MGTQNYWKSSEISKSGLASLLQSLAQHGPPGLALARRTWSWNFVCRSRNSKCRSRNPSSRKKSPPRFFVSRIELNTTYTLRYTIYNIHLIPIKYSTVSSANNIILHLSTSNEMSHMFKEKRRGPSIESWSKLVYGYKLQWNSFCKIIMV